MVLKIRIHLHLLWTLMMLVNQKKCHMFPQTKKSSQAVNPAKGVNLNDISIRFEKLSNSFKWKYLLLLLLLFSSFSRQRWPMVSRWSLSDNKSPQVSRILLSILADLNNAVVWMVPTRPLISESLYQSFGDCTKNTNYNRYNRHFHVPQFFQFPSKVQVLILLFIFFQFYCVVSWDSKFSLFLLIITRSDRLADIRWSVCISKSQRSLCILFFRTDVGLCVYHLFTWSDFNFLYNSQ